MRKIDLRISAARKKLADSIYKKQAIEIDRRYSHIKLRDFTFHIARQEEKVHFFQLFAEWMKIKVRARLQTYLDAFKEENVIPDEADLSQMSWAFQEIIDDFTASLPQELNSSLQQLGRMQVIEDARRDIDLFTQRMIIEQMRAEANKPQPPPGNTFNMYISENHGPIQQGGSSNTQNTNRNDNETK